jgi:hypothetical protein
MEKCETGKCKMRIYKQEKCGKGKFKNVSFHVVLKIHSIKFTKYL